MMFKSKIRNDRSGVSTLLTAAIAIVVVVVVVAAAYVVLSGSDGGEETIAPGTVIKAEIVLGDETYLYEDHYIGQNADMYFIKTTTTHGSSKSVGYSVVKKKEVNGVPDGAVKVGEAEVETIHGLKDLEVWEYTDVYEKEEVLMKAYLDPAANWLVYKGEITFMTGENATYTLLGYEPVFQKSYKESKSIGKTYGYAGVTEAGTVPVSITCIADCINGQYGMLYDFSMIHYGAGVYFLSDNIQGLPTEAVNTGGTYTMNNTINGNVDVERWAWGNTNVGLFFYYEPFSHIIYGLVFLDAGKETPLSLVYISK